MAPELDEIDQHLLAKIDLIIDQKSDQSKVVTKSFPYVSELREVKKLLLEPPTSPKFTNDNPKEWLSVRRDCLYQLNDLVTEWETVKKHSSFNLIEDGKVRWFIKNSLETMKKELTSGGGGDQESVSKHQEPNNPKFKRNKEEVYRWSSRHGPRKVHGIEHVVMAMERDLVMRNIDAPPPLKVFGVVGVAGIGKTTLCQAVFGLKSVKEHFSPRIWVCLSKQPRNDDPDQQPENDDVKKRKDDDVKQPNDPKQRKEIVMRVLEGLGIEDEVINDVGNDSDGNGLRRLILLLRLQLVGKRYLIVLDDAWNHNKFFLKLNEKEQLDGNWGEELAYALPKGCGGSVISSSRSDALLKKMLGKDVGLQYLKPYSNTLDAKTKDAKKEYAKEEEEAKEEEAKEEEDVIYEIFKDTVIGYDEDKREFPEYSEELRKEILKKCNGVPLAAKLLAKVARKQLPMAVSELPAGVQEGA